MNAYIAHLINSAALILIGAWGYFVTDAKTALIPVLFGVVLLSLSNGVKLENKAIAHVVVVLTLLVFGSLVAKPLMSAINDGDTMGTIRVGIMSLTSLLALIFFIKSFIDARKARNAS
ncbi:MAG: hypothetical protein P1U56_06660 [Saprospiraceae bacterium]|nr:hypothetical protein [Saprospiraceae bacterium]